MFHPFSVSPEKPNKIASLGPSVQYGSFSYPFASQAHTSCGISCAIFCSPKKSGAIRRDRNVADTLGNPLAAYRTFSLVDPRGKRPRFVYPPRQAPESGVFSYPSLRVHTRPRHWFSLMGTAKL